MGLSPAAALDKFLTPNELRSGRPIFVHLRQVRKDFPPPALPLSLRCTDQLIRRRDQGLYSRPMPLLKPSRARLAQAYMNY